MCGENVWRRTLHRGPLEWLRLEAYGVVMVRRGE